MDRCSVFIQQYVFTLLLTSIVRITDNVQRNIVEQKSLNSPDLF